MTTEQTHLRRELGFWSALTIGSGTMIGAGIFLLSGLAVSLAGPSAIFSYLIAGVVCIITAASAAELATGMPTSGGDYFFVSRSLGPAFGAISGIGIWLSLTFAIAFYLFGMGEYLHTFLPISPFWGAILGGVIFTLLNVIGAKESGGTQVVVVLTLLVILILFILAGIGLIDPANYSPFAPFGSTPIFTTTALVFISFLGFVKIAAVSEEIKEPSKNLPRALIGSVALVTTLYVLIVLVLAGVFSTEELTTIKTPLTLVAEMRFGAVGAAILIFAGLLATLSSANASIMAASRINLAMSRDRMIPHWLSEIHPKRLTPYRAILLTGILAMGFLLVESLETLAEIASVLQLYSYAALNIGCIVLRVANPDWYRPTFRVPLTPYLQIVAAIGCLLIVLVAGPIAQAIIVGLIIISLAWYFIWGRSRVDIRYGLPLFRQNVAEKGWGVVAAKPILYAPEPELAPAPSVRLIDANTRRRIMVALANPEHEVDLLRLGRYLAVGHAEAGEVLGIHFVVVPLQTPLESARGRFAEKHTLEESIASVAAEGMRAEAAAGNGNLLLAQTGFTAITDVAHDVFGSLIGEVQQRQADLLLMGWQGGFNVSHIYNSPVQRVLANAPSDVVVLKNRGMDKIASILIPWGGGPHAQLGLELAVRVGRSTGAAIHLLRVLRTNQDPVREQESLRSAVQNIIGDYASVQYHVPQGDDISDVMMASIDEISPRLLIVGASHEWRLRSFLFGSIPDVVADHASCSVLMVRRHLISRPRGN
ncbi:MAG: amino acid permease [Caldilineales bacterium]|nr:amino acid permease [Caldilineales bacterium]